MSSTEKNNTPSQTDLTDSPVLFLSDVHLGAFSDVKNQELENDLILLIDYCERNKFKIIILGDFFDYWMEYSGKPPPLGKAVLKRFEQFHSKTNSHTLFVTGNHDNWTGLYLQRLGFDVEHEYRIIRVNGTDFLVLHGDGLRDAEMNFPRPAMHRLLRNPYFTGLYQTLLPSRLGWQVMKAFSGSSKWSENTDKSRVQREAIDKWARNKVLKDNFIQAIIYGHHHYAMLWQKSGRTCMNCGFFGKNRTAGMYINKRFQIVIWDAGKMILSEQ